MKVTRPRKTYDAVAKGEPLIIHRTGRKVTVHSEMRTTKADGTILDQSEFSYYAGCPVKIDDIVVMKLDEDGKIRGGIDLVVTDIQRDGGRWCIRMERTGTKHRPVPADDRNYFLAPKGGYTTNSRRAIDELPSMDYRPTRREPKPESHPVAPPRTDAERADRMANIADELAA